MIVGDVFLNFALNIDCWCSKEPTQSDDSNVYPQSIFGAEIRKIMYTPVNINFPYKKLDFPGCSLY